MRILVTGGKGFIGSHLVRLLRDRGHQVHQFDSCIGYSVLNSTAVKNAMAGCDIVYHLAAMVGVKKTTENPLKTLNTNIIGTAIVAKVAKEVGAKMFFASSSEVYGKAAITPMSEEDDLRVSNEPRWDYAHSKLVGERYIRNILPEDQYLIGRFFNVVGPGQYPGSGMVLPRFIDQAIKNEYLTVYGTGKSVRCFGYVDEIVKAVVQLTENHSGVFNICGTERGGIYDLAKKVIDVLASNSEIARVDGPEDSDYRVGHTFKLQEALGWVPNMSIERIIQLTAGWRLQCMESRS